MEPKYIEALRNFLPCEGLSLGPYCNYCKPSTKKEQMAWHHLQNHDIDPEKVDNR